MRIASIIERVEAYDPRQSLDNRADEMPLDLEIAKVIGLASEDWQVARGSVTGYFSGDGVGGFGNPTVPRYTRSLDAAMTLVPDNADAAGERLRLEAYNSHGVLAPHVRASAWVAGAPRAYAATPALALCAAALRVRAALQNREAGDE
ncbi:hypothetical protein FJY63_01905 [Candidatus Sumerlaeota bacterium]|nr:hypothetical protein [Candidatus Sumerlaeota bacterium]